MDGGRLAWWVRPVNTLMAPAARRGRRRPGPSFSALEARAARRTGVPERADPEFRADLRVLHESFLAVQDLSFIGLAGVRAELLRHLSNRLRVRRHDAGDGSTRGGRPAVHRCLLHPAGGRAAALT